MSSIVHPLMAFKDYGGVVNKFFTPIPKRNWAKYFDDKIKVTSESSEETESDDDNSNYEEEGEDMFDVLSEE